MSRTIKENVVLFYLNNVAMNDNSGRTTRSILRFSEENTYELFGFQINDYWQEEPGFRFRARRTEPDPENEKRPPRNLTTIRGLLKKQKIKPVDVIGRDKSVDAVMKCFDLDEKFRKVVAFFIYVQKNEPLQSFWSACSTSRYDHITLEHLQYLALFCQVNKRSLASMLKPASPLFTRGVLMMGNMGEIELTPPLERILRQGHIRDSGTLRTALMGIPKQTQLNISDFSHLGDEILFVKQILSSALTKRTRGVNILLYGAPGVGKTEFATALCNDIGAGLYEMGGRAGSQSKKSAIGQMVIAQRLMGEDKKRFY